MNKEVLRVGSLNQVRTEPASIRHHAITAASNIISTHNDEGELNKSSARIMSLETLLSSKDETIRKLSSIIESQKGLEIENESLKAKINDIESETESKLSEKEIQCREGYLADLLKLEGEIDKFKKRSQDRDTLEEELERTKRDTASLTKELQYYKSMCESQTNDIRYFKEQLEKGAATHEKRELDEYKQKINEENEFRIRNLLSENGLLKIQLERLQREGEIRSATSTSLYHPMGNSNKKVQL